MNEIMLDKASEGRNNNLNFIRFLAAIMVIYSHSYPLSIRGGVLTRWKKYQMDRLILVGWQCISFSSLVDFS